VQFLNYRRAFMALTLFFIIVIALTGCGGEEPAPPAVVEATATDVSPTEPALPATWTPIPAVVIVEITAPPTQPPPATSTPPPTATEPPATATSEEEQTEELAPTETASPQPTTASTAAATTVRATVAPAQPTSPSAPPTLPPNPTLGVNLLPNPSFEEGHYNQNGIPELQLPNGWRLEYREDATGFGGQAWDVYVRPETRVLPSRFLPPEEHGLYIFDGDSTVKIFKGNGAINAHLLTELDLQRGTYVMEGNFFSDVFEGFVDRQKVPPLDPSAGEATLFAGSTGTGWVPNNYLAKNTISHTFTLDSDQRITVGIGFRGRYALANNGWFVDNLSLRQIQ
jgi:hypothetical protein